MSAAVFDRLQRAEILSRFTKDAPYPASRRSAEDRIEGRIAGCTAIAIAPASDRRGDLFELLSTRDAEIEPMVHAYQVFAEPGSIRAWVYHAEQTDRLSFVDGKFRVVLFDLREDSATTGALISVEVGEAAPTHVTIPPFVAHGVQNIGSERSSFLNLPTRVFRPEAPDKYRLPFDSGLIPFEW